MIGYDKKTGATTTATAKYELDKMGNWNKSWKYQNDKLLSYTEREITYY
jgi:hypothetical protein